MIETIILEGFADQLQERIQSGESNRLMPIDAQVGLMYDKLRRYMKNQDSSELHNLVLDALEIGVSLTQKVASESHKANSTATQLPVRQQTRPDFRESHGQKDSVEGTQKLPTISRGTAKIGNVEETNG